MFRWYIGSIGLGMSAVMITGYLWLGIAVLIGVPLIVKLVSEYEKGAPAREEQKRKEAEAKERQAAEEAEQCAREARDRDFQQEQRRLEEDAGAQTLRSVVNELLDYAGMLEAGADRRKVVQAVNDAINRLIQQQNIQPHHFKADMLQFDVGLIFRRLEAAGLGGDIVMERLRKVLQQEAQASMLPDKENSTVIVPPTTGVTAGPTVTAVRNV